MRFSRQKRQQKQTHFTYNVARSAKIEDIDPSLSWLTAAFDSVVDNADDLLTLAADIPAPKAVKPIVKDGVKKARRVGTKTWVSGCGLHATTVNHDEGTNCVKQSSHITAKCPGCLR